MISEHQKGIYYRKMTGGRFPGEIHAILQTPHGNRWAAFTGPHTQLKRRLTSSNPEDYTPVSGVDAVALRHDLEYSLAKTSQDIRNSDARYLKRLKTVKDTPQNKMIADMPIRAKYNLEGKLGKVLYPSQAYLDQDNEDPTLRSKLMEIEAMEGGCCDELRRKIYGKGLTVAGAGLKLAGSGRRLEKAKRYGKIALREIAPYARDFAIGVAKNYFAQRGKGLRGGFLPLALLFAWIGGAIASAMPTITAGAAAAATALATGAVTAVGKHLADKALKGGAKNAIGREIIEEVKEVVKIAPEDFSSTQQAVLKEAEQIMRTDPSKSESVIKMIAPIIEKKLSQKISPVVGSSFKVDIKNFMRNALKELMK